MELSVTVQPSKTEQKITQSIQYPFGTYNVGTEGILEYRPRLLLDFFLFYRFGILSLPDGLYFFLVSLLLYINLGKVSEQKPFSNRILRILTLISVLTVCMYPVKRFNQFACEKLLEYRTNNMFHLMSDDFADLYIYFGCILGMFVFFIRKGFQLQQEQELTV
jgi:hypothetical protein